MISAHMYTYLYICICRIPIVPNKFKDPISVPCIRIYIQSAPTLFIFGLGIMDSVGLLNFICGAANLCSTESFANDTTAPVSQEQCGGVWRFSIIFILCTVSDTGAYSAECTYTRVSTKALRSKLPCCLIFSYLSVCYLNLRPWKGCARLAVLYYW